MRPHALLVLLAGCGCPPAAPAPASTARIDPSWAELPAPWRCEGEPWPSRCYVHVPGARVTLGAQAVDPAGPGYDPAADASEGPVRTVDVPDVWIGFLEVATPDYGRCIHEGGCRPEDVGDGPDANRSHRERVNHPINAVTWEGAQRYCAWMGGRLPTEAEWELAARGTDGRRWPWGQEPGCGTGRPDPAQPWVRSMDPGPCRHTGTLDPSELRGASPYGLIGMAGNVWEWTADTVPAPDGGAPLHPQRGGGWAEEDPLDLRVTVRALVPGDTRLPDVGFRCVWEPPERRAPTP